MSSVKTVYLTSENLIKDLAFKQMLGLKADLIDEVVSVVEFAVEKSDKENGVKIDQDQLIIGPFGHGFETHPATCCSDLTEIQINLKLFLASDDPQQAAKALRHVIKVLQLSQIDSLILAVPLSSVAHISIGMVKSDDDEDQVLEVESNPEKDASVSGMINLWNCLAKEFVSEGKLIQSMGLCDLETNVFKQLYNQAQVKPTSVQVNLKSCCTVPPPLQSFAKEKGIKLHTHCDPMAVLGNEFTSRLPSLKDPQSGENLSIRPTWLMKMQSFIKSRGVLADKRYIVEFVKTK